MKFAEKAKKYGFKTPKAYRDHLAQLKGYLDYDDYRRQWRARNAKNRESVIYREYP